MVNWGEKRQCLRHFVGLESSTLHLEKTQQSDRNYAIKNKCNHCVYILVIPSMSPHQDPGAIKMLLTWRLPPGNNKINL